MRQLYRPRTIPGRATPEGTRSYFAELRSSFPAYRSPCWFHDLAGPPGYRVSRLGFGTYRVARNIRPHIDALREALISGTNVIDTAANYADGEAERLVGELLYELTGAGRVRREQVVLVGKAGYIQGRNLEIYERNRERYQEAVPLHPRLLHCIQPEFLADQIDLSRQRLGVETIDVFLLHNPEYFLTRCQADGVSRTAARDEYHRRIGRAFECLEDLARSGHIAAYGISSNTFAAPRDSYTATDLERILGYAPPGFRAIQFPANLLETDFRYSRLTAGGVLADVVEHAGLWSMSNRPLNASVPGRSLVRLARFPNPPPDEGASDVAEFNRMADRLAEAEEQILRIFAPRHFAFDERTPSPGSLVYHYKNAYSHRESFRQNRGVLTKEIQRTVNSLQALAMTPEERFAIESLARIVNDVFGLWERYVDMRHHYRMQRLEQALTADAPALKGQPLAVQAVLFLLAQRVPGTVLVGMRQVNYVRQLHEVYGATPPEPAELLSLVSAAEATIDEL